MPQPSNQNNQPQSRHAVYRSEPHRSSTVATAPRIESAPTKPNNAPVPDLYKPSNSSYMPAPVPSAAAKNSSARERSKKRRSRRHGADWAWVVIALALMSIVGVVSLSLTLVIKASQDGIDVLPTAVSGLPTPVDAQTSFAGFDSNIASGQQLTLDDGRNIVLQPWNGGSRLTVLVMGLDRRPGEDGLAYRTDTMMLLSLDRDTGSLGILSIPRDLYVDIPGYSELQRINSAMVLGELQQPNYGPTLAMQTAQLNFGMYVHGYVVMDFQAVVSLIDLLGGIEIDVPYNIVDYQYPDMNFGYDPLILNAGTQHMDGQTALKFARTRHGDNDFERARRQQMVLYAIRDRVLDFNLLPQLIVQSPTLLSTLNENVYTNLSLDQIIQIAMTLKDMSASNIRTGVLDGNYSVPYTTPAGAQVIIPRRAMLGDLLSQVFGADYSE
ncbi:MAG: putative LytR family transcriptional protein [Chloroflexi bacterium OLB15]|nr:MAG: putative LytR family transcriptional protein [Chloroflexi bacterium OLB15]